MESKDLVRRGRCEPEAWRELYQRLLGELRARILVLTRGTRIDPDDIVQETSVRVWEFLDRIREPERVARYAWTVAKNEFRKELIATSRLRCLEPRDVPEKASLHSELGRVGSREWLDWLVAHLTDDERELYELYFVREWRHSRVAAALDISEVAARKRVSRLRRRFREIADAAMNRGGAPRRVTRASGMSSEYHGFRRVPEARAPRHRPRWRWESRFWRVASHRVPRIIRSNLPFGSGFSVTNRPLPDQLWVSARV